jgi:predicted RecB family nuclease
MESIGDIISSSKKKVSDENKRKDEKDQEELFDSSEYVTSKYISGKKKGYVTKEYQSYGAWLAHQLNDENRMSMYIKWAKEKPRSLLESAYRFTADYPNAKDKSRLFMWKVKELEEQTEEKKKKAKQKEHGS